MMISRRLFIGPLLWLAVVLLTGCKPVIWDQVTPSLKPVDASSQKKPAPVKAEEPVDTTCAYFYFLWGRHAELSHHFDEALEAYEKALICDPQADHIMRKLPILLIRMGRPEEAVDWLTRAIAKNPEETGSRLLLAKVLVRLEKYDEAAKQYQAIQNLNPEEETGALLLGELYARQKKYAEAEKTVKQLLEQKSGSYGSHVFLARIFVNQEKYDEAVQEYHTALDLNWSAELIFEMGELLRRVDTPQKAIALYRQIIKKDEANEKARIALVHTYIGMQRDDLALTELRKLREITEHPTRIDLIISRIYAKQKKFNKSAKILQQLIKEENSAEARYLLALVHVDQDEFPQALEQLQKIPEGAEEYEESVLLRVKILRKQEKTATAISLLEKVVDKETTRSTDLFIVLASLYLSEDKADQGKAVFNRARVIYPDDNELLYEYALFLDQKGERQTAFEEMEKVIKADPHHSGALNYIGYTWADNNENLAKALEYIQLAVKLKPENAYIRDSLGWVYYRLGKNEQAKIELQKALELAEKDPHIHDHLGDVYLELGMREKAIQEYRQALELFGDDKDRVPTENKLKTLKE